jgi:hypothetical protein
MESSEVNYPTEQTLRIVKMNKSPKNPKSMIIRMINEKKEDMYKKDK